MSVGYRLWRETLPTNKRIRSKTMEQANWKEICDAVCGIAKEAGEFIAAEQKGFTADRIEVKGRHNFVSDVDKRAEQLIVSALSDLMPEAAFIAEEGSGRVDETARYQWIVDPLDGTTNFLHGMPPYAVCIALMDMEDRKVKVGVVYEVTLRECFYAWEGGGAAFLNGEPIRVSETSEVEDALVITGMAYGLGEDMIRHFVRTFDYFNRNCHGARRLGSAAADLIYVACGRAEAFYQLNLSPWDVAAGAFIVEQAGGRVTDFKGGDDYVFGRSVLATNRKLWEPIYKLVTDTKLVE